VLFVLFSNGGCYPAPYCAFGLFVILRLVYHMLPVTLDCPFLIALRFSLTFIYISLQMKTSKYGKNTFIHASFVLSNSLRDKYPICTTKLDAFKTVLFSLNGKDCKCM
jgi:hypothetical protein